MKINYRLTTLFLLASMPAGIIFNVSATNPSKKGRNISLDISRYNSKKQKVNYLNLGIMSNYQYLEGASINILSDIAKYNVNGVQLSGFVNIAGYKSNAAQIAGLANISGYKANGFRFGGLMNISGSSTGVQISGLGNISSASMNGFNVTGLLNMCSDKSTGIQIAGLSNISGNYQNGISVSGIMNVCGENMKGAQISSLINIAGKTSYGFQFSSLSNINIENKGLQLSILSNYSVSNKGVQAGIANISSSEAKGVQFGLLNISNDSCNVSRQIGLINIKPQTNIQIIASSGNINKAAISVRFRNKILYTQIGAGLIVGDMTDKLSVSATYRTGLSLPVIDSKLRLNTDIGYSHIETLNNHNIPDRLYSIQPRLEIEYSISKKLGISASGGYSWTRTYKGNSSYSRNPILEIGIIYSKP